MVETVTTELEREGPSKELVRSLGHLSSKPLSFLYGVNCRLDTYLFDKICLFFFSDVVSVQIFFDWAYIVLCPKFVENKPCEIKHPNFLQVIEVRHDGSYWSDTHFYLTPVRCRVWAEGQHLYKTDICFICGIVSRICKPIHSYCC